MSDYDDDDDDDSIDNIDDTLQVLSDEEINENMESDSDIDNYYDNTSDDSIDDSIDDDNDNDDVKSIKSLSSTIKKKKTIRKKNIINPVIEAANTDIDCTYIYGEDRQLSEYMDDFEFARILGIRAESIANGNMIYVKHNSHDAIQIAKLEISQKMCPLNILRELGEGSRIYEVWSVNELIIK